MSAHHSSLSSKKLSFKKKLNKGHIKYNFLQLSLGKRGGPNENIDRDLHVAPEKERVRSGIFCQELESRIFRNSEH